MRKNPWLRRFLYVVIGVGFVAVNPLHLPFSLPWLARRLEGSFLGTFLSRYEGTILVVSTVYFLIATFAFYTWMSSRRTRRGITPPATGASMNGGHAVGGAYRGPGGGKTPPRHSRRRIRR